MTNATYAQVFAVQRRAAGLGQPLDVAAADRLVDAARTVLDARGRPCDAVIAATLTLPHDEADRGQLAAHVMTLLMAAETAEYLGARHSARPGVYLTAMEKVKIQHQAERAAWDTRVREARNAQRGRVEPAAAAPAQAAPDQD